MSSGPRVAVLDYEMNNLLSACKALTLLGAEVTVARSADEAQGADAVVLPGVGAFGEAMRRIRAAGLDVAVHNAAEDGRPVLGICLGMQLLLDSSEESPGVPGLGLIPGVVERLDTQRKVPQIGWNTVTWSPDATIGTDGAPAERTYYFVHSFAATPRDKGAVWGSVEYGGTFTAAVGHGNVAGVQFHPEKSSRAGLALLGRWLSSVRQLEPAR